MKNRKGQAWQNGLVTFVVLSSEAYMKDVTRHSVLCLLSDREGQPYFRPGSIEPWDEELCSWTVWEKHSGYKRIA